VDQVFLVSNKQLRPNRNGNLYLQLLLSDKSGTINAMLWNATEHVYKSFDNGDYVHVGGTAQLYQGEMQVIVANLERVSKSEVDEGEFIRVTNREVDRLAGRLAELLRGLKSPPLRALAEAFLVDESLMQKLAAAPAAVKNHHAYRGGLIEHVVTMIEIVLRIADLYPQLDGELLAFGAFLHDLGKIDELAYERELAYTDEGQLLGHITLGIEILNAKIRDAERLSGEELPRELVLRLKHMILSHHGSYDFGSPRLPMTLEAIALTQIDNLDAKIVSFEQLMREDPNVDSAWTPFQANLNRKLFKGARPLGVRPPSEEE
jgi:3'-5' exoribonuclease